MRFTRSFLAAAVLTLSVGSPLSAKELHVVEGAGCTMELTFLQSVPGAAHAAVDSAARIFADRLVSPVPIRVRIHFRPLPTRAATVPNGVHSREGLPVAAAWYPSALADALAGRDLQPGEPDFEMFFNTTVGWHFDATAPPSDGRSDVVSISLHELAHGLGVVSLLRVDDGIGSYGRRRPEGLPPLAFEVPDLEGLPTIFDTYITTRGGQALLDAHENPSRQLGDQLRADQLFFSGAHATRLAGGRSPRLHGPDPSHLHLGTYESGPNELMSPRGTRFHANHEPGAIVMGIFGDLGWTITEESPYR